MADRGQMTADRLQPLQRVFFDRPTDEVARDLLGALVCRETGEGLTVGRIVETEAYGGPEDRASHARAGRTPRTMPMFGEVGHAYVYLVYGMHECLNVVAHNGAEAGAVLLRALEPLVGVELMRSRRGRAADPDERLCAGPARSCQAMAVDRALDGHDLTTGESLWLAESVENGRPEIAQGARIGVDYATDGWAARPWRFWLADHQSVSRP
ncbi:MAG: DNA-3-methyladenine glycosylase [Candidatus Limnocylindrales bacterium]